MAKKKPAAAEFAMFDVIYEDGTRSSNRKVPAAEPYEPDYEARVRANIEEQDRAIAAKSGRPRAAIKAIVKSGAR